MSKLAAQEQILASLIDGPARLDRSPALASLLVRACVEATDEGYRLTSRGRERLRFLRRLVRS